MSKKSNTEEKKEKSEPQEDTDPEEDDSEEDDDEEKKEEQEILYRPSFNSGIFGSYSYGFINDEKKEEKNEVKKEEMKEELKEDKIYNYKPKIQLKYRSIHNELMNIKEDETPKELDKNMKIEFDNYKKYAKIMKKPLIKFDNTSNYNKSGLLNTIGINKNIKTFDKSNFIKKYCKLYGLHISQVKILSVKSGSVVIEIYITNNQKYEIDLNKMRTKLNDKSINKELHNIGVFCLLFGEPTKKPGWENQQTFRNRLVFNAQYNRIYGKGNIVWEKDLKDGRKRGKPYYCPVGWQKRAVAHKFFTAKDFETKFDGWPICYHGTKFAFGMSMLLSGFIPSVNAKGGCTVFGDGVYLSPSILYSAHPRYAEPAEIPKDMKSLMKGNWIQFVLQCRVNPNAIHTISHETLTVGNQYKIDKNFDNNEVEWVVGKDIIEDPINPKCQVYVVGIMIRITDKHPYLLEDSNWWKVWPYGVPSDVIKQKNNGEKASIILMD